MAVLSAVSLSACRKEEQAVAKAAQNAVSAEKNAQAAANRIDIQRVSLAAIPLPTKSLYVDVHDPNVWANPFLSVNASTINLRVEMADANPSPNGQGSLLRPASARRQEIEIRPGDLAEALVALPPGAWRYGRVVAIAESPLAARNDRPAVRRNVEATIQKLNDLGIVVEEWPTR